MCSVAKQSPAKEARLEMSVSPTNIEHIPC